jgi:hypothetical protein
VVDADPEALLRFADRVSTALTLLYLPNQFALVHLLQSVHYSLALGDLLSSVFDWRVWSAVSVRAVWTADVERSHHVLPADVTYYHLKGQTLGIWVLLKDLRNLALGAIVALGLLALR